MGSRPEYIEANREIINFKRRKRYCSETRKADYKHKRDEISQKGKLDVKPCPICKIDYRRTYLKKHMINRHKMSEDELPHDLCITCVTTQ